MSWEVKKQHTEDAINWDELLLQWNNMVDYLEENFKIPTYEYFGLTVMSCLKNSVSQHEKNWKNV